MIPSYLASQLDEEEQQMAKDFIAALQLSFADYEEDCSLAPPYHYEVQQSGIGDTIWIVCGKKRLALLSEATIDSL